MSAVTTTVAILDLIISFPLMALAVASILGTIPKQTDLQHSTFIILQAIALLMIVFVCSGMTAAVAIIVH